MSAVLKRPSRFASPGIRLELPGAAPEARTGLPGGRLIPGVQIGERGVDDFERCSLTIGGRMPLILIAELLNHAAKSRERNQLIRVAQPTRPLAGDGQVVAVARRERLEILDDQHALPR